MSFKLTATNDSEFIYYMYYSYGYGGAMFNQDATTMMINCTFTSNGATYGGALWSSSSTNTLENCILWNNTGGGIVETGDSDTLLYTDTQDGTSGTGNLDTNPEFAGGSQPYELDSGSPCLATGKPTYVSVSVIIDPGGDGRTTETVDMGAYAFQT